MHLLQYDLSPYFLWQGHVHVMAAVEDSDDNHHPDPAQVI
jgi:hypothetical protein